jgi:prolyl oligopeptidase
MPAPDPRPTVDAPDDDPYLWLEDIEGPRALDWVEAQNAATLQRFGHGAFAADRDALKAIFDRPDNIPYPARHGGKLFNFWRDAAHPRGLWRTCTLESFRSESPTWDVLLDLDALAAKEGEDWTFKGASTLPGTHDRAILYLSRGGADAVVLREFDLATRDFVPDGFHLPESKGGAVWLDRDTLLLLSPLGPDMATRSGYARTVRQWRRGTEPLAAPVIFETQVESLSVYAGVDRDSPVDRLWFFDKPGLIDANVWIGDRTGPKTRLDVPTDASLSWHRGWLAVKPRTAWTVGGETHETDTVVVIPFAAFLAGDRRFTKLFEPGARRALQSFFWCGARLVLSILDDLNPVFEVLTPADGAWSRERIAGLPDLGTAYVWPFDLQPEESNGDLLAGAQDPITPPSLFLIERGSAPVLLRQAPQGFDPAGLVVHAARGRVERWHAYPLCTGRAAGRDRQRTRASLRLRRLQHLDAAILQPCRREALARARRHQRDRAPARRTRIRHRLVRGRAPGRQAARARRFRGRGRRSRAPRCDAPRPHRRRRRIERRLADRQHAHPLSRALRCIVLHHAGHRHAPLHEAAHGGGYHR